LFYGATCQIKFGSGALVYCFFRKTYIRVSPKSWNIIAYWQKMTGDLFVITNFLYKGIFFLMKF